MLLVMAIALTFLLSCKSNSTSKNDLTDHNSTEMKMHSKNTSAYKIGDHVPNQQVCMVNNAFMNEKQIEVPVNGKVYYGCCEMCKEKLAKEESSRFSLDPETNNKVDKANAYIAITGDKGVVSYFENEQSYRKFFIK